MWKSVNIQAYQNIGYILHWSHKWYNCDCNWNLLPWLVLVYDWKDTKMWVKYLPIFYSVKVIRKAQCFRFGKPEKTRTWRRAWTRRAWTRNVEIKSGKWTSRWSLRTWFCSHHFYYSPIVIISQPKVNVLFNLWQKT